MVRSKLAMWSFIVTLFAYLLVGMSFITENGFITLYSFMIGGMIGIITLILGIISLRKINKSKLKGKRLAIVTIILSAILICIWQFWSYIF